jgi:hypothetical protein
VLDLLPEDVRELLFNALSVLTNRGIWIRVGTALSGILLMLIGLLMLMRGSLTKVGTTVAKAVL